MEKDYSRRTVLGTLLSATGLTSVGVISGCGTSSSPNLGTPVTVQPPISTPPVTKSLLDQVGDLLAPDNNGVMMPLNFTSRIVARSREVTSPASYVWHDAPDGGAVFHDDDGGWTYVSNCERSNGNGGVGALVFDSDANVIDSYPILEGTSRNCAGGATPWGSWLSCEETANGSVWECDPAGLVDAIERPALGYFLHEAVAVDPETGILYMTEDQHSGLFYRFIPNGTVNGNPDLSAGRLQAAIVNEADNTVTWGDVSDPSGAPIATRDQVNGAATFNGGEGIVFYDNVVSFVTKGDNRVWAYQTDNQVISIIYDRATSNNPILSGVDNVTVSFDGELIISEDGGDLQIVAITSSGRLVPIVQLVGHDSSEITGPAFSPDGKRLYFSSQRGTTGRSNGGITFEVTGPFHV